MKPNVITPTERERITAAGTARSQCKRSPYLWPEHIARQHPLAGERRMIRRAWRKE